jgi:hypothetical protein
MIIVKVTQTSETGVTPSPELIEAMGKYIQELTAGQYRRLHIDKQLLRDWLPTRVETSRCNQRGAN